jgi:hypothetical protein
MISRLTRAALCAGASSFWCIADPAFAQTSFMADHYRTHARQSRAVFLREFPYAAYLNAVGFSDFTSLQSDRLFLWNRYGDGDEFLYALGDAYLALHPPTEFDRVGKINLGEAFISARGTGITVRNRGTYRIIGYYILNHVAEEIQHAHAAGHFDPNHPENLQIIQRLARDRVHLAFEESTMNKVLTNARQGRFGYIFQRLVQRGRQLVGSHPAQGARSNAPAPRLSLVPQYTAPHRGARSNFTVFRLFEGSREIGQAVYMRRPMVRTGYVATDVQRRFWQKRREKHLVVAATGGFTNNYSQPEGLTVENGNILNTVLMPDRDGLVLLQPSGAIRVLNLRRNRILLPNIVDRGTVVVRHPQSSLRSFARLLQWCKSQSATVFQTQLMAYGDSLLIRPERASPRLAERRMLAVARDRRTGDVYTVIFNIPVQHALYDLSASLFDVLASRGLKVEALLNLDTGGQDVFYLYDIRGRNIFDSKGSPVRGGKSTRETTNLLLFWYET